MFLNMSGRLRHARRYFLAICAVGMVAIHAGSLAASPPATPPTPYSIDKPLSGNQGIARPYDAATDAPVLIVLGQSNAVGWTNPMPVASRGNCTQLSHVKGLSRALHDQVGLTGVTWEPYSCGGFVVSGGAYEDGWSYHLAGEFAKKWQQQAEAALTNPALPRLPDLHVIHVAWGGQGIAAGDVSSTWGDENRWWPGRNPTSKESLYPQTRKLLALAFKDLLASGKKPRVIGLHWNQWETDNAYTWVTSADVAQRAWGDLLNGFRETLGNAEFPIYLYRPRSSVYSRAFHNNKTTYFDRIVTGLAALANAPDNNFRLIDAADATNSAGTALFIEKSPNFRHGIFADDTVHYVKDVQLWFARKQWDLIETGHVFGGDVTQVVTPTDPVVPPTPAPSPTPLVVAGVPVLLSAPDYTGDRRGDFLFGNGTSTYVIWAMNGTTVKGIGPGRSQATDWRVVAQADLDGDAQADVLWQQASTRKLKLWAMKGGVAVSETSLSQVPAEGWQIATVGDFDGDGKADVLWHQAATGRYVIWFMNGATVRTGADVKSPATGWRVIGSADFNADRKADILWGETAGPGVAIWLMNGAEVLSGQAIEAAAAGHRPVAVADFNGDRAADILWFNADTSDHVIWHMSGLTRLSAQSVTRPAAGWTLQAVGDVDQDSKADLLWRQASTGKLILWLLAGKGSAQAGSGAVQTPATGWSIVR